MKTKLLFLVLMAFAALQINAQCDRSGSFIPDSPDIATYPVSGTANITQAVDGTLSVNFESDFDSVQGFRLEVFLSTTQRLSDSGSSSIQVSSNGELLDDNGNPSGNAYAGNPMTGTRTFNQNLSGVELEDYDFIIIQCLAANVPWGYAQLGAPSADCETLSTDETAFNQNISLFPNPANDQFEIHNELQTPVSIAVYNVLGKQVQSIENSQLKNQKVSLSNLNSGVYLVQITSDTQRIVKKLIKR